MHHKLEDVKKERSLPERLRRAAELHSETKDLLLEAANEIERLRPRVAASGPNHYSFHKDMWEND